MRSISRAIFFVLCLSPLLLPSEMHAQRGVVEVYVDQHRGNPTASGERYEPAALTAAHALLPMGTFLRVTNTANGRAVDVRVNDRKAQDGRLVYISGAAGGQLGVAPGQSIQGAVEVLAPNPNTTGVISPPSSQAVRAQVEQNVQAQQQAVVQQGQRARTGWFQKKKSIENSAPFSQGGATSAPVVAQGNSGVQGFFGRLFGNRNAGAPMTNAGGSTSYQYPEPVYAPDGLVLPMSAPYPAGAPAPTYSPQRAHQPAAAPPRVSSSSLPVGPAAPYRVQFGAFNKAKHAEELNTTLLQGGVSTMVVQSTANQLFLVVTQNGFPTASEAQRWVDFEGRRRGWTERPVVIR